MSVYVDIGAKRIQVYLARTPALQGRRGASYLLDRGVLHEATGSAWRGVAIENTAAKRTDGLLSFELPGAADLVAAGLLVTEAVRLLRAHAPGAEWEITVAAGVTYQEAQQARKTAERHGQQRWLTDVSGLGVIAALAPLGEVPVVRLCGDCGLDPAVTTVYDGEKDQPRCADCLRRFATARASTPAEDALRARVAAAAPARRAARVADTFGDLAGLADDGDRDSNHLCTVFIDGNRFGDLFKQLTGSGINLGELSVELATAMGEALVTATLAVTDVPKATGPALLPVIPHLVGGDDLLASVVADRAWKFTRVLLATYRDRVAALVARYGAGRDGVTVSPTASAGLVFAHASFPFATSVALAETALREAKAEHAGQRPAVRWVDVTAEGPTVGAGRRSLTLDDLDAVTSALDRLALLPASGRVQLGRAWARSGRYAADATAAQAVRLGVHDAVRPFLRRDAVLHLPDALSILRWWRS